MSFRPGSSHHYSRLKSTFSLLLSQIGNWQWTGEGEGKGREGKGKHWGGKGRERRWREEMLLVGSMCCEERMRKMRKGEKRLEGERTEVSD